jgi:hypothetical protein
MPNMVIKGIAPYDGTYELDTEQPFNGREWRWVKKISGYMPATMSDGFRGMDPDLFIALAVVAMCRAHRINRDQGLDVADELSEANMKNASIMLEADPSEEDVDEIPLDLTPTPEETLPQGSLSSVG